MLLDLWPLEQDVLAPPPAAGYGGPGGHVIPRSDWYVISYPVWPAHPPVAPRLVPVSGHCHIRITAQTRYSLYEPLLLLWACGEISDEEFIVMYAASV